MWLPFRLLAVLLRFDKIAIKLWSLQHTEFKLNQLPYLQLAKASTSSHQLLLGYSYLSRFLNFEEFNCVKYLMKRILLFIMILLTLYMIVSIKNICG